MSKPGIETEAPKTRKGADWRGGAMLAFLIAMAVVIAVVSFTLNRHSPLVATPPNATSEPSTDGQGGIAPVLGRRSIER